MDLIRSHCSDQNGLKVVYQWFVYHHYKHILIIEIKLQLYLFSSFKNKIFSYQYLFSLDFLKYCAHLGCKIVYLQLNGNLGPIHGIALMPLGLHGLSTNQLNGNALLGVFECKTYVVSFLLGRLLIDHDRSRVICIHRRLLLHFFTRVSNFLFLIHFSGLFTIGRWKE